MDYISRFVDADPALHPWDEANLIVMDKVFDMLLDLVCQYFTEDFCKSVHHGYWPEIFFFSCVSDRFWYQDDVGQKKEDSFFLYCLE